MTLMVSQGLLQLEQESQAENCYGNGCHNLANQQFIIHRCSHAELLRVFAAKGVSVVFDADGLFAAKGVSVVSDADGLFAAKGVSVVSDADGLFAAKGVSVVFDADDLYIISGDQVRQHQTKQTHPQQQTLCQQQT